MPSAFGSCNVFPMVLERAVTRATELAYCRQGQVYASGDSAERRTLGRGSVATMRGNVCLQYECIKCCLNTEMPLSNSDITRIRDLGFSENSFVVNKNGNLQLKNLSGRCVFHNGQQCTIYNDRPDGCQLYPAIFHEDKGEVILDSYCPHHEKFQITPSISREVLELIRKLDAEKT